MSEEYKILIAKGEPSLLTAPDQDGNTPLHEAVISGHLPMVESLVKKFATPEYRAHSSEIDKENHHGNTPLHLAFQFDHPNIVEFLVQHGANSAIKNHARVTAPKLGGELRRADCLDILRQTEEMRGTKEATVGGLVGGAPDGSEPLRPSNQLLWMWAAILLLIALFVTIRT